MVMLLIREGSLKGCTLMTRLGWALALNRGQDWQGDASWPAIVAEWCDDLAHAWGESSDSDDLQDLWRLFPRDVGSMI